MVGLSSWFQKDAEESNLMMPTPQSLAGIWKKTLDTIAADGLLDAILYVDLCNEWPFQLWAPFFDLDNNVHWGYPSSLKWMRESIATLREAYPGLPYTFSNTGSVGIETERNEDLSFLDFLEPHLWMVHGNNNEFYRRIGYTCARFDPKDYENVVKYAQNLYEAAPDYWDRLQRDVIDRAVEESERFNLPLMTTECWSIVDYKDWPLLDWEWVKRSCAAGVRHAASTGRWLAIATSNFCGPQFVGMWRDKDWHRRQTDVIKGRRTAKAKSNESGLSQLQACNADPPPLLIPALSCSTNGRRR